MLYAYNNEGCLFIYHHRPRSSLKVAKHRASYFAFTRSRRAQRYKVALYNRQPNRVYIYIYNNIHGERERPETDITI